MEQIAPRIRIASEGNCLSCWGSGCLFCQGTGKQREEAMQDATKDTKARRKKKDDFLYTGGNRYQGTR